MYLPGALHLDIQQDVHALLQLLFHEGARRAVGVGDILGMLQQLVLFDHLVIARPVNKEVLPAVHFAGTGLARRDGGGEAHIVPPSMALKTTVLFPAPEGPEITISLPLSFICYTAFLFFPRSAPPASPAAARRG